MLALVIALVMPLVIDPDTTQTPIVFALITTIVTEPEV
jgi:hypothetical protein